MSGERNDRPKGGPRESRRSGCLERGQRLVSDPSESSRRIVEYGVDSQVVEQSLIALSSARHGGSATIGFVPDHAIRRRSTWTKHAPLVDMNLSSVPSGSSAARTKGRRRGPRLWGFRRADVPQNPGEETGKSPSGSCLSLPKSRGVSTRWLRLVVSLFFFSLSQPVGCGNISTPEGGIPVTCRRFLHH